MKISNFPRLIAVAALLIAQHVQSAFVIVDEPVPSAESAQQLTESLLFNRSTLPVVQIGQGEAGRVGGSGNDIPLSVASTMIIPLGWSIYSLGPDISRLDNIRVSWTNSSTWIDVLRVMASTHDMQVVVDWVDRKITVNDQIEKGRWQKSAGNPSLDSGIASQSIPTLSESTTSGQWISLDQYLADNFSENRKALYSVPNQPQASSIQINPELALEPQLAKHGLLLVDAREIGKDSASYKVVVERDHNLGEAIYIIPPQSGRLSEQVADIASYFGWSLGRPGESVWLAEDDPYARDASYRIVGSMEEALTAVLSGKRMTARLSASSKTIYIKHSRLFKWGFK